ncbi:MAG: asparaginase, partial [Gemmatimonadales bacterium]|nr:asparaginase [Gemmatimonadales bacterium]
NCSGKHAGMMALARHHGWPVHGYERAGHPVQDRMTESMLEWTGVERRALSLGVDGCTVVCFALPLTGMALAYARFGTSNDAPAARLRGAMVEHPWLVAGTGRLCTDLMAAAPGQVIAKIGAEGVYSAALPALGLGLTLKIDSGEMRAAAVALVGTLSRLLEVLAPDVSIPTMLGRAARFAELPIRNTRDEVTGSLRAAGALRFHD